MARVFASIEEEGRQAGFTLLNESNFQIWKTKLELMLIRDDLWDVVDTEIPAEKTAQWVKQNGKAKAMIGLLVEDKQLLGIKKIFLC